MNLRRVSNTPDGTFGVLLDEEHIPICVTLENPWQENQPYISCIPTGLYRCKPIDSPRFGKTWEVVEVPGRTHILFHWGNKEADTQGCILLGTYFGELNGVPAILNSRSVFDAFIARLERYAEFYLDIK